MLEFEVFVTKSGVHMVDNGTVTKIIIGKTAKVTLSMWTRIIPIAGEVAFFTGKLEGKCGILCPWALNLSREMSLIIFLSENMHYLFCDIKNKIDDRTTREFLQIDSSYVFRSYYLSCWNKNLLKAFGKSWSLKLEHKIKTVATCKPSVMQCVVCFIESICQITQMLQQLWY